MCKDENEKKESNQKRNMKKIILLAVALCVIKNSNAQWINQTSNTTNHLSSVCFVSPDTGYAVGAMGTIVKTINGGNDWSVQPSLTSYNLKSICFADNNVGYIVGQYGRIFKTMAGGNNWLLLTTDTTYDFNSVCFISADTGFITGKKGDNGYVLKTTNGGTTWLPFSASYGQITVLNSVHFDNSSFGLAAGYFYNPYNFYPLVLKTTNGGTTWSPKYPIGSSLYSVHLINADTGYTVGVNNSLLKTNNGGDGWITQYCSSNVDLTSVFFTSGVLGYAVGSNGTILKTTDGGNNWDSQVSNTSNHLNSVCFANSNIGYAVGNSGTILKTINGGIITNNEFGENDRIDVVISPNPFNDIVQLECLKGADVEIINPWGQVMMSKKTQDSRTTLNLAKLDCGVYFIRIKTDNAIIIKKIIKD